MLADLFFLVKKVLTALILPPTGPLLMTIVGLALIGRWPRIGRVLAWSGAVLLLLLALPTTSKLLVTAVDIESGMRGNRAPSAQAIVILGGGRRSAPEYGGETVSGATLERIRYGAKLAKELHLPVLVTGGAVFQGTPEAQLMAQALRESFAVEVKWIENRSRDTHENAVFSSAVLRTAGIKTVLLVTHDLHERRGVAEFSTLGIEAIPAPVSTISHGQAEADNWSQRLPNANALQLSSAALHEILGNLLIAPRR